MDLIAMNNAERFNWMRKRHAFLNDIVKSYSSLDDFAKDKEEWFALLGTDLTRVEDYVYLYMWLDYGEYEMYFVIPNTDGHLTVSEVILWPGQPHQKTRKINDLGITRVLAYVYI